jgi:hypothetical protein
MKIYILVVLALCSFPFGYYLGVEDSSKSETKAHILESTVFKGYSKCVEAKDWKCLENNQNMMFMFKKIRIDYLLKNDFNIELGQPIKNYRDWLSEQITTK